MENKNLSNNNHNNNDLNVKFDLQNTDILDSIKDYIFYYQTADLNSVWENKASRILDDIAKKSGASDEKKCHKILFGLVEPCKNCPVKKAFQTKNHESEEFLSDGGKTWRIDAYPAIGKGNELTGVVEVIKDVTIEKKKTQTLTQKLTGRIAHDFNNLLMVISGYSELILSDLAQNDPLKNKVKEIQMAGERAAILTRQLLTFSNKQVISPKLLLVNNLLRPMENILRQLAGEQIELDFIYSEYEEAIFADKEQIEQIVMNLVLNACDAMLGKRDGKIKIRISNITIEVELLGHYGALIDKGQYVLISVLDNGEGMDTYTTDHIFEPLFSTKEGKGAGLNLSSVYEIVQQFKGFVTVESEMDTGTEFKIYLPQYNKNPPLSKEGVEGKEKKEDKETSYHILLVDDDANVRNFIKSALLKNGHKVAIAVNGFDALEQHGKNLDGFDLIITDIVMPKMDGIEFKKKAMERYPSLKFLLISGYSDKLARDGVLGNDVEYIQKPFGINTLISKIHEILED